MNPLLNVDSAIAKIIADMRTLEAETVSLPEAFDRVLAEDIVSPIDLPPFDNSAMDGYALRYEDSAGASQSTPATLAVTMDILAGSAPEVELNASQAARIMTGAPIPPGVSAVIPVEDTDDDWSKGEDSPLPPAVRIHRSLRCGENIRRAGENVGAGETIMKAGRVIGAAEIGMIAAVGRPRVSVIRQPKVVILSSGDELVDIYDELRPGKIRDTNGYSLAALIRGAGGLPIRLPIAKDRLESIRALHRRALAINPDMIISSAGVSVGAADLVRTVMDELGEIDIWRINMRPGKPLAYGTIQGLPFFGLPGNPVSSMVTFEVIVRPALAKIAGRAFERRVVKATIADDMRSDGRRTYARVTLTRDGQRLSARATGIQSSGALMSMVLADGLAIIPEDTNLVPAGSELEVLLLRGIY